MVVQQLAATHTKSPQPQKAGKLVVAGVHILEFVADLKPLRTPVVWRIYHACIGYEIQLHAGWQPLLQLLAALQDRPAQGDQLWAGSRWS